MKDIKDKVSWGGDPLDPAGFDYSNNKELKQVARAWVKVLKEGREHAERVPYRRVNGVLNSEDWIKMFFNLKTQTEEE